MKKFNKIMVKIAVVSAIISVVLLGVVYALEQNSKADTYEYPIQYHPDGDTNVLWPVSTKTGKLATIRIEKSFEVDYCVAWPRDEFLDLSGKIWKYHTDLEQWVVCY